MSTLEPLGQPQSAELVSLAGRQNDTRAAFNRFLEGVERRAFRRAHLAVGNVDDALEIVQEAMLQLVQHYADRAETEWPLLFQRVLQNRITDFHRRQGIRQRLFAWLRNSGDEDNQDDPLAQLPDPAGRTPLETLLAQTATDRLLTALAELPLRQQQAFLLRMWDGFDTAETAFAMECSEGSVKTHLSRALRRLRDVLEECAP